MFSVEPVVLSFCLSLALGASALLLVLFRSRNRLGLGGFYVAAGILQFLAASLAVAAYSDASPALAAAAAATAPSLAFVTLLLYLREDIPRARTLIYGVLTANVAVALLGGLAVFILTRGGLATDLYVGRLPAPLLLATVNLVAGALLAVVVYELLAYVARWLPRSLRIGAALLTTAALDLLSVMAGQLLAGNLVTIDGPLHGFSRLSVAVAGTALLALYLKVAEPPARLAGDTRTTQMLDVFSIITYRRRYRLVKQQLEVAESASRAKSRFLAHMSHELRTPLNAIIGFTNVLLKAGDRSIGAERENLYLKRISQNARDLLHLINGLLDLAKIEAGQDELLITRASLNRLVSDTVDQLRGTALNKDLQIRIELPEFEVVVATDHSRLKQVVVNLVGNAIKFTDRGEVVTRLLADPETHAPRRIAVSDTGIGISTEKQNRVFEAFEQVDNGHDRSYGGTGLGLSLSRALCEQLGYRLVVDSAPKIGSTFSILFTPDERF